MYHTKGQTLHLTSSQYNMTRVINALARIVKREGGAVQSEEPFYIVNRHLNGDIVTATYHIQKASANIPGAAENRKVGISEYIKKQKEELKKMESINRKPVCVKHSTYLSFTLDGMYYYYQFDENPFFPFYYIKTAVFDGKRDKDACLMECNKEWLRDELFSFRASEYIIRNCARILFNSLVTAKPSVIRRDTKRVVTTVTAPQRLEKITF